MRWRHTNHPEDNHLPVVIPPWLKPPDSLGAAEAGARIGLSAHEVEVNAALRRAEMAQRAGEMAAAQGLRQNALEFRERELAERQNAAEAAQELRRDQLGLTGERLQQTEQQNSAVDALRKAQMDETARHNKEIFDLRQKQFDRSKPEPTVVTLGDTSEDTKTGAKSNTSVKLTASEYANYLKAHQGWVDKLPNKAGPHFWSGTNPDYTDYITKNPEPHPTDFLTPAASTLTTGAETAAPETPAAPSATATNPKTGEKLIFQNGQWQPMPQQ